MTRATIIWFVGAAVVGAVAGGLHLLRSQIGGAHTGLPLAVSAFALTAIAAAMLFHGVMVAAREQDAAAGPAPEVFDEPGEPDDTEPTDEPAEAGEGEEADGSEESDQPQPRKSDAGHQDDEPSHVKEPPQDEGPDFYTFRGGKPVKDRSRRTGPSDRPPRS